MADDLENHYTPEEADELLDWVDRLELSEIKYLKKYWEELHKGNLKIINDSPIN